mmetsp:Transcript_81228/g.118962  ORF Transcript_81228/g.118962 Transcript_81228/m.118962 type:complete len:124 (+) Transcript_81228:112-483(+)
MLRTILIHSVRRVKGLLVLCSPWRRQVSRAVVSQLAILIPVIGAWTMTVLWYKVVELQLFGYGAVRVRPSHGQRHGHVLAPHTAMLVSDLVGVLLYFYGSMVLLLWIFLFAAGVASMFCYVLK